MFVKSEMSSLSINVFKTFRDSGEIRVAGAQASASDATSRQAKDIAQIHIARYHRFRFPRNVPQATLAPYIVIRPCGLRERVA